MCGRCLLLATLYAARMIASAELPGGMWLRPLNSGDAPALLDAYVRNREHLRPLIRNDPTPSGPLMASAGGLTR